MTVVIRPRPLTGKPGLQISLISSAAPATAHEDRCVAGWADRYHSRIITAVSLVDRVVSSAFQAQRGPIQALLTKDALACIGKIVQVDADETEATRGIFFGVCQCFLPCLGQFLQVFE